VITIHDLTYKRFPELLQKETLENLEREMAREVALADAIICVSESTRRDLLEFYRADPSRAIAIHSGLAPAPPAEPIEGLPSRYILFVSTIEPRKDLGTLISAFERLNDPGISLVVVGKVGWKSEAILPRLRKAGIVHLDYLKPSQLATAYERAEAFVFPSIYEGFGFPLLEAMRHGIPSIAARSSSLPEIGGDAALYFETGDVDALTAQLRRVLNDGTLPARRRWMCYEERRNETRHRRAPAHRQPHRHRRAHGRDRAAAPVRDDHRLAQGNRRSRRPSSFIVRRSSFIARRPLAANSTPAHRRRRPLGSARHSAAHIETPLRLHAP
jgi:glycosyltransferase involved in cell wall biosynthesis